MWSGCLVSSDEIKQFIFISQKCHHHHHMSRIYAEWILNISSINTEPFTCKVSIPNQSRIKFLQWTLHMSSFYNEIFTCQVPYGTQHMSSINIELFTCQASILNPSHAKYFCSANKKYINAGKHSILLTTRNN